MTLTMAIFSIIHHLLDRSYVNVCCNDNFVKSFTNKYEKLNYLILNAAISGLWTNGQQQMIERGPYLILKSHQSLLFDYAINSIVN